MNARPKDHCELKGARLNVLFERLGRFESKKTWVNVNENRPVYQANNINKGMERTVEAESVDIDNDFLFGEAYFEGRRSLNTLFN